MSNTQTAAEERIPVTVLTGFLGSGKTTLLNKLLRRPELSDTAVIINEFGEIGLDHLLVEKSNEDGMVTLNSGCLCCTVRGDLVRTMSELFLKRSKGEVTPFKRMVVETTGLADPAPILHTLMTDPLLASRYRLDGVVTTVDGVNGGSTLDNHEEAIKQAAVADRLLLTKVDIAEAPKLADLKHRLAHLNPGATAISISGGEIDPNKILNAGLYNPDTKTADVKRWLIDLFKAGAERGDIPKDVNFETVVSMLMIIADGVWWRRALDPNFKPEALVPLFMDITRFMLRAQSGHADQTMDKAR